MEDIIPYQKQLILATANGVTLFNPQTGKCKLLFQDKNALYNTISTIGLTLDHEGTLWIANNNSGACAYHFDSQNSPFTNIRTVINTVSVAIALIPFTRTVKKALVLYKRKWTRFI